MSNLYLISAKSCPYAHRIEILLNLMKSNINILWCDPEFKDNGWSLDYTYNGSNPKQILSCNKIEDLYRRAIPEYTGRYTVPVLYDLTQNKIISNESKDIIKFLLNDSSTLYPSHFRTDIDYFCSEFEQRIGKDTYVAGHAKTSEIYSKLFDSVFDYLDKLNERLSDRTYIMGDTLTMCDVYVFPHLIRFDLIFYNLFLLNKKHLWEYPHIKKYIRRLLNIDAFINTLNLYEIKKGGYLSINNRSQNLGCLKVPLGNGGFENFTTYD